MENIVAAFKRRSPMWSALVALIFDPIVAALFLNRGWLAVGCLVAQIVLILSPFALASTGLLPFSPFVAVVGLVVVYKLAGIFAAYSIATRRDNHEPLHWYAKGFGFAALTIFIVVAPILLRSYAFAAYTIPSESMMPTLKPGDYVIADKMSKTPQRGDVIVFKGARQPQVTFVKRVIGLPGDEVRLVNGQVFINNVPIARQLIRSGITMPTLPMPSSLYGESVAGHGTYRIVESGDGPVSTMPAYKVPPGHYFVLGDYRDNSLDSRMPDFGDAQADTIEGKMVVIAWHGGTHQFAWDRVN